jgi:hypothetical protein
MCIEIEARHKCSATAEDLAHEYKQQQRVEEAWRTMKSGPEQVKIVVA